MFQTIKNFFMKKRINYKKEELRGSIKQIMKVRGLRSVNFVNYDVWCNTKSLMPIHSVKFDLQDGYINLYSTNDNVNDKRSGKMIENATEEQYQYAYDKVQKIIANESHIPSKTKRNILVKVTR